MLNALPRHNNKNSFHNQKILNACLEMLLFTSRSVVLIYLCYCMTFFLVETKSIDLNNSTEVIAHDILLTIADQITTECASEVGFLSPKSS